MKLRVQSLNNLLTVVRDKCAQQNLRPPQKKLDEFVLVEAEKHSLNLQTVKELANYLNIPFIDPPLLFNRWEPSICKNLKAVKYSNPYNHRHYIVMIPHKFAISYLSHDPTNGFDNIKWFADFVPRVDFQKMHSDLINAMKKGVGSPPYDFSAQPGRAVFSKIINKNFEANYPSLDPVAIRAIHALFDFYLPEIEGICPKCFQTSFAKIGQGIRYYNKATIHDDFEISLSPKKTDGQAGQQRMYIRNILKVHGQKVVIKWEPWKKSGPILVQSMNEFATHMPYRPHDQSKLNALLSKEEMIQDIKKFIGTNSEVVLSICQCI